MNLLIVFYIVSGFVFIMLMFVLFCELRFYVIKKHSRMMLCRILMASCGSSSIDFQKTDIPKKQLLIYEYMCDGQVQTKYSRLKYVNVEQYIHKQSAVYVNKEHPEKTYFYLDMIYQDAYLPKILVGTMCFYLVFLIIWYFVVFWLHYGQMLL